MYLCTSCYIMYLCNGYTVGRNKEEIKKPFETVMQIKML